MDNTYTHTIIYLVLNKIISYMFHNLLFFGKQEKCGHFPTSVHINPLHSFNDLPRFVLMYHCLLSDSLSAGHLCPFQSFAVINNSAGNILTTIASATATINPE